MAASVPLLTTVCVVLSSSLSPLPSPCPQYGNLVVIAGLIDPHGHPNVPGTYSEGVGSGMSAAAADGTTTVLDVPLNSAPATASLATLRSDIAAFVAAPDRRGVAVSGGGGSGGGGGGGRGDGDGGGGDAAGGAVGATATAARCICVGAAAGQQCAFFTDCFVFSFCSGGAKSNDVQPFPEKSHSATTVLSIR